MTPVPTISDAAEFSAISNEAFVPTFIFNLNKVFDYQTNEIPMIFEDRKLALITKLRKELLSTVLTKFPEFAEQTPLPHSTKNDKISDIIILGHALARPEGSNDLQNIFIKETVPLSAGVSHLEALKDPDTLVAVVTQMKLELDAAKTDIATIKTENETLLIAPVNVSMSTSPKK